MNGVSPLESVLLLLNVVALVAAGLAWWPMRTRPRSWALGALLLLMLAWLGFRALALSGPASDPGTVWWRQWAFSAAVVFTALWQTVALRYSGRVLGFSWAQLLAAVVEPVLCIVLIFNSGAPWLLNLSPDNLRQELKDPLVQFNYNPALLIHGIYCVVLFLSYSVLLLPPINRRSELGITLYRKHGLVLLVFFLGMQISALAFGSDQLLALLLTLTSTILIIWAITRLRFIDLQPLVRETFLDDMQQPALAIDTQNRLVNLNNDAAKITKNNFITRQTDLNSSSSRSFSILATLCRWKLANQHRNKHH
jgi:hypothetical protein